MTMIWFHVILVIFLAWFELGTATPNTGCGTVVTTTNKGKRCIEWKWTKYSPKKYPYLKENICANPSGSGTPWCYVGTKGRYERCDCPNFFLPQDQLEIYKAKIGKFGCPFDKYGKYDAKKIYEYNGKMDRSRSGYKCMNWSEIPYSASGTDLRFVEKNYARTVGKECASKNFWGKCIWTYVKVPHCYVMKNNKRVYEPFLNPCV